jgi:hypothetical protein
MSMNSTRAPPCKPSRGKRPHPPPPPLHTGGSTCRKPKGGLSPMSNLSILMNHCLNASMYSISYSSEEGIKRCEIHSRNFCNLPRDDSYADGSSRISRLPLTSNSSVQPMQCDGFFEKYTGRHPSLWTSHLRVATMGLPFVASTRSFSTTASSITCVIGSYGLHMNSLKKKCVIDFHQHIQIISHDLM